MTQTIEQLMPAANSYLNNEMAWLREPMLTAPTAPHETKRVQDEIDVIAGKGRDGRSWLRLVWNGDSRYWKERYIDWDKFGKPLELWRRPWVLFKSIFDEHDVFERDAFPPRWLLLSLLEPEQYADTWARDSVTWCPDRRCNVQMLPADPPKEYFAWFKTIAKHNMTCCREAGQRGLSCFGQYDEPGSCLDELRLIKNGMMKTGFKPGSPFDAPDAVNRRLREKKVNNYEEQQLRKFKERRSVLIDEASLAATPFGMLESGASLTRRREAISEATKRGLDKLEQRLNKSKGE